MNFALAAMRLQLALIRKSGFELGLVLSVPAQAVVFAGMAVAIGGHSFRTAAAIAPVVMALWAVPALAASEYIEGDLRSGALSVLASAGRNRIPFTYWCRSLVSVALVGFVGYLMVFCVAMREGVALNPGNPLAILVLFGTIMSGAAIAVLLGFLFVGRRWAFTVRLIIVFPVYVLSGAFVPLAVLPEFVRVLAVAQYPSALAEALRFWLEGNSTFSPVEMILVAWVPLPIALFAMRRLWPITSVRLGLDHVEVS